MYLPFMTREPYPSWYLKHAPIAIFMPWRNLGCLGFRVGFYYVDFYRKWSGFPIGIFVNTGLQKFRVNIRSPFEIRKER